MAKVASSPGFYRILQAVKSWEQGYGFKLKNILTMHICVYNIIYA